MQHCRVGRPNAAPPPAAPGYVIAILCRDFPLPVSRNRCSGLVAWTRDYLPGHCGAAASASAAAAPRILSFIMRSLIRLLLDERPSSRYFIPGAVQIIEIAQRMLNWVALEHSRYRPARRSISIDEHVHKFHVWKFASKTASDIEFDRHIFRLTPASVSPLTNHSRICPMPLCSRPTPTGSRASVYRARAGPPCWRQWRPRRLQDL